MRFDRSRASIVNSPILSVSNVEKNNLAVFGPRFQKKDVASLKKRCYVFFENALVFFENSSGYFFYIKVFFKRLFRLRGLKAHPLLLLNPYYSIIYLLYNCYSTVCIFKFHIKEIFLNIYLHINSRLFRKVLLVIFYSKQHVREKV